MALNVLKDRGIAKNKLLCKIIESDDICSLLLDKHDFSEEERHSLIYKQIFPFLFINDTQTEVLSYLCFDIKIPRVSSSTKNLQIIVWACCHKDAMQYYQNGYLGDRADILADMVERQINQSKEFGIGKINLQYLNTFYPNTKYYAVELIFDVPDFKIKDN